MEVFIRLLLLLIYNYYENFLPSTIKMKIKHTVRQANIQQNTSSSVITKDKHFPIRSTSDSPRMGGFPRTLTHFPPSRHQLGFLQLN